MATKKRAPKPPSLQERLLKAKEQHGTYVKLAKATGFSVSQLHDWAHGEYEPTQKSLRKLAEALDCNVTELMGAA